MECSLPMDGRRVSLTQLSKDSFRECQASLTLTDLLIIIFSGISVSVVAIMTSFFLASTVHCFQRWSKGTKGDEEESEEWGGRGGGLLRSLVPGNLDGCEDFTAGGCGVHNCHTTSALWSIQDCLTVGSCPHTVEFLFCFLHTDFPTTATEDIPEKWTAVAIHSNNIILVFFGGLFSAHSSSSWLLTLCYRPTDRKRGATYFWRKMKYVQLSLQSFNWTLLKGCCWVFLIMDGQKCLISIQKVKKKKKKIESNKIKKDVIQNNDLTI